MPLSFIVSLGLYVALKKWQGGWKRPCCRRSLPGIERRRRPQPTNQPNNNSNHNKKAARQPPFSERASESVACCCCWLGPPARTHTHTHTGAAPRCVACLLACCDYVPKSLVVVVVSTYYVLRTTCVDEGYLPAGCHQTSASCAHTHAQVALALALAG